MQGHTSAYILKEILFELAKLQVAASRFFFLVHSDLEELSTCSRVLDLEALALGAFAPGEDMTKRACNFFLPFGRGMVLPFLSTQEVEHGMICFGLRLHFFRGRAATSPVFHGKGIEGALAAEG